jgi:TRAP-type uncharacterized transport system substrate-binding protein
LLWWSPLGFGSPSNTSGRPHPKTLIATSGAPGSAFHQTAEDYREILARNGIELRILESRGAMENLERLSDPKVQVDIGFVQSGVVAEKDMKGLVSLGSLYYEPLWVFYRGARVLHGFSQLRGKRLAVGAEGSGTRVFALRLLKASEIDETSALPRDEGGEQAVQALSEGDVDAAFLIGNSSTPIVRELRQAPGIALMSLVHADGYVRRFPYLYKLVLPRGTLDFGKDVPAHDVVLVGPTAELIAREELHPALSDLLIEAAQEVHGGAGLFRRAGSFPPRVSTTSRSARTLNATTNPASASSIDICRSGSPTWWIERWC